MPVLCSMHSCILCFGPLVLMKSFFSSPALSHFRQGEGGFSCGESDPGSLKRSISAKYLAWVKIKAFRISNIRLHPILVQVAPREGLMALVIDQDPFYMCSHSSSPRTIRNQEEVAQLGR